MITNPNDYEHSKKKLNIISKVTEEIIKYLNDNGLSFVNDEYLESHAFAVQDKIKSRFLKSLHVMETGE